MNIKYKKQKGFTILESIVAIAILSLSISGAFSAVQQSLSQAVIAKDEVKAFYLAQEAIEIIRNKRESSQLARINSGSGSWLDGITQGGDGIHICPFGNTCSVDATNFQIFNCGIGGWGTCPQNLKQDPTTYLYNYATGSDTNFKREIQIESITANEIAIAVRVSWTKGLTPFEFKAKTLLFNWIYD